MILQFSVWERIIWSHKLTCSFSLQILTIYLHFRIHCYYHWERCWERKRERRSYFIERARARPALPKLRKSASAPGAPKNWERAILWVSSLKWISMRKWKLAKECCLFKYLCSRWSISCDICNIMFYHEQSFLSLPWSSEIARGLEFFKALVK